MPSGQQGPLIKDDVDDGNCQLPVPEMSVLLSFVPFVALAMHPVTALLASHKNL